MRTCNGGGIGILIGDWNGRVVSDNLVAHNRIDGTLTRPPVELGGYNGTGIVAYADYRFGSAGAAAIAGNRFIQNRIGLVSDTPELVDVVAIELTEAFDDPDSVVSWPGVIHSNAVGFNDLRDTTLGLALSPGLDALNDISRNLGGNRGHGLHPRAFLGPVR